MGDGWRVWTRTIGANAVWSEQRLILEHLTEEALGRVEIRAMPEIG
jgi:hypothetical protein